MRRFTGTASAVLCLLWNSLTLSGQLPDQPALTAQPLLGIGTTTVKHRVHLAGTQSQTSIAVDTTGQHIVIGFNDTRGADLNPIRLSGFVYSDDGGATFVDGGQLPSAGADAIGEARYPQIFGDPEVKYLGGSNFVYFSMMIKKVTATALAQTMCVYRSTDYGHTWEGPFEVSAATNPHGLVFFNGSAFDSADKELADVDPETGRVLMSWVNFTSTAFAPSGVEISSTYSDDILTGTPPTWSRRTIVSATAFESEAPVPRFAAGSSDVYIAWQRSIGTWTNNVGFARSTDNGATFGAPVNVAPAAYLTMDQVPGNDRVHNFPSMAVDNSNGPFHGNLYIVYASNAGGDGADVMLQRSTDHGVSFLEAIALDSRPANDRAQWHPWVTVDQTNGRVYAFYYDQGIATSGDRTEISVQYSDDGGATWSRPTPLMGRSFHAGHGNDSTQPNLGDYNQAIAQNGELFAVFAATSQPAFTDGLPLRAMTTPDVFFKRTSPYGVSLSAGPQTFTDSGGNGAIDRGEQISLSIPLTNYVTNELMAAPISGISATLSSPTNGVSIRQGTSAYPALAPGATAPNLTPFVIDIGATFAAGTRIELTLYVTTDHGSTVLSSMQATGSPIATTLLTENFDGVTLTRLPAGWASVHVGGNNIISWRTTNTFMKGGSNAAFHANANDGLSGNHTRVERLLSPVFDVPTTSEYVTLDFDLEYDTEDEPTMKVWAYDGLLLRIADIGPSELAASTVSPAIVRSVLAEAFDEEFTTGAHDHYPKHLPRSFNANYLEDMSVWAGNSAGVQHVRMKLRGMAGRRAQLRFEYTQDSLGTCADVRPGSKCGVAIDNVIVTSAVSSTVAATQTTVTASQNPSDSGEPVTFTATVTSGGDTVTAGTVTFRDGTALLAGPLALDASGRASFTVSSLTTGSYTITADYGGDGDFQASSGSVAQAVDPLPAISIGDVSVAEGNDGASSAVFMLTLSAATHTATAQVDIVTADGTATTADNDYAAAAGTVSFAPGQTTQTIAVSITRDNIYEPDESFVVNLSHATHATIADGQGAGTILNDDPLPTIAIADVSVTEGNTGTTPAVFTVSLSNPSSMPVSVNVATADGTALAASDYVTASGSLSFAPLETTKTITVSVTGDFVIEPDEIFTVNLSNATGATIADGQAVGAIRNDDTVETTLAALIDQVTRAPRFDDKENLLDALADVQRSLERRRPSDAIKALRDFISEAGDLSRIGQRSNQGRSDGSDRSDRSDRTWSPRFDPADTALWIEEAQSIIIALTN